MTKELRSVIRPLLVGAVACALACHPSHLRSGIAGLQIAFTTPGDVQSGETLPLRLVLLNRSNRDIWLPLGTEAERAFNPIVAERGGDLVWQRNLALYPPWHPSQRFPPGSIPTQEVVLIGAAYRVRLAPGDSMTFQATWPTTDFRNQPVAPGRYIVTAILVGFHGSVIGSDNTAAVTVR